MTERDTGTERVTTLFDTIWSKVDEYLDGLDSNVVEQINWAQQECYSLAAERDELRKHLEHERNIAEHMTQDILDRIIERDELRVERDDSNLLLDAAIEDRDYWKNRYQSMKERAAKRLQERDTLRSAMQSAIVLIDNGEPHKAHGVLSAAVGEGED